MPIYFFIFILLSISSCLARTAPKRNTPGFKVTMASLSSTSSTAPQMTLHKLSSRYLQTTSRKLILDDGRVVQCRVPLLDDSIDQEFLNETVKILLRILSLNFTKEIVPEVRNLTSEEVESQLLYLTDECTRYRTPDFLWEFCHNKYIRQFDDDITIHNARKPEAELFFLGFHSSVDPQKFVRTIRPNTGPYQPEIDYDIPLRGQVPVQKYLHTHGRIAKIVNIRSFHRHTPDTLYFIRAYVPAKELNDHAVVDLNGKTLKYYKKNNIESRITKIIDGNKYVKLERFILKVLNSHTALLDKAFPMDISTTHTKIFPYTGKIDRRSSITQTIIETITTETLLFDSYVYGQKGFLSTADIYSSALLITNKSEIFSRVIVEVIDDSVLRLDETFETQPDIKPSTLIFIEAKEDMKDVKFIQGHGKVWLMGNIILGEGTSFKKDFERGDLIMLLQASNTTLKEENFEVLKVVHDTIMIVRHPMHASRLNNSTSLYTIGKYFDLEKYGKQFSESRKRYKDNSVNSLNTETLNNLLLFRSGKKIENDEPFCHPSFYFPNPKSWLMTFEPRLLNRNANLMLHLSNIACNTGGIEINFNHMDELIIVDPDNRLKPFRAPLIRNPQNKIKAYRGIMWIIFDQGILAIGQGSPISLENQILSIRLSNELELSHYTINKEFTYNVELANIEVQTLPSKIQETFNLIKSFTPIRGNATYIESYGQGTYCGASNFERRTDIEYKCSQNDAFFEIEKVKEDATCHYRVVVGTNLLCPDKRRDQKIAQKSFNINCITEEI